MLLNCGLEKTLESTSQSLRKSTLNVWTDAEAEAPTLWPLDAKSWLIRKDPDAGKDWGQEGKRATEYEMVGWHHRLNGYQFEQNPAIETVREGRGSWRAAVHGVAKSLTWLSDWTELNWWIEEFRCSNSWNT